jgi:hypothetical protein
VPLPDLPLRGCEPQPEPSERRSGSLGEVVVVVGVVLLEEEAAEERVVVVEVGQEAGVAEACRQ